MDETMKRKCTIANAHNTVEYQKEWNYLNMSIIKWIVSNLYRRQTLSYTKRP